MAPAVSRPLTGGEKTQPSNPPRPRRRLDRFAALVHPPEPAELWKHNFTITMSKSRGRSATRPALNISRPNARVSYKMEQKKKT